MNILGIDTSGPFCSVAITTDRTHYAQSHHERNQHTNVILPMIKEMLAHAELTFDELDLIGWCCGPGSFTGLRIGASVVQSLAYMDNLYVANVSTLRVLAQTAYQHYNEHYVLSAIDARKGEVYWGRYQLSHEGVMVDIDQAYLIRPSEAMVPYEHHWLAAGSGWTHIDDMVAINRNQLKQIDAQLRPTAGAITHLAKNQFEHGQVVTAFEAIPNYLRQRVG